MQHSARGHQLAVLVFEVEGHRYGVPANEVHEIVRAVMPARLPRAPAVIVGVINVRGRAVPLVDLRARFGLSPRALTPDEVFVLVAAGARMLAFRADRALELARVPRDALAPIAESVPRASFVAGTVVLPSGVLLLCDVTQFLDEAELKTLDGALSAEPEPAAP